MNNDFIALSRKIKKKLRGNYAAWHKYKGLQREQFSIHEINAMMLLSVEKPVDLAKLVKKSFFQLEELINEPVYRKFYLRKKRGGYREITAPAQELLQVQKRLNYYLQARYLCIRPSQVHGFTANPRYLGKSCNIVENARPHVGRKHILNIDLRDFFPGIIARRVLEAFMADSLGFNVHIAHALTLLVTFEGSLPVGAPTSPVISNFVCLGLDRDLQALAEYRGFNYTRYADDITFSSDHVFSEGDLRGIEATVEKHHFRINQDKTRLTGSNCKQTVTGLVVNEKVNIDRRLLKKIRAMVHDCTRNGLDKGAMNHLGIKDAYNSPLTGWFINRLSGYISFLGQVRGSQDPVYKKLKTDFEKALKTYY
jgi:RNA-directed DNA polymerase